VSIDRARNINLNLKIWVSIHKHSGIEMSTGKYI
jgi:hypothetical protein